VLGGKKLKKERIAGLSWKGGPLFDLIKKTGLVVHTNYPDREHE